VAGHMLAHDRVHATKIRVSRDLHRCAKVARRLGSRTAAHALVKLQITAEI
jgi:hypothetical protein